MRYPLDWNDLRFFLAVARTGSLSGAARHLRVDAGTVSRRVSAMELALGIRCFERRPDGYPLTEQGVEVLQFAERIENEVVALDRTVDANERKLEGVVAITADQTTGNAFVVPSLSELRRRHGGLRIELISDNRVLSLSRREVDIALRMARSEESELLSRRIGVLRFGVFASETYLEENGRPESLDELAGHSLIDWVEDYPRAPPAVWLRSITSEVPACLKVSSSQDRLAAANAGLGITILPYLTARSTPLTEILTNVEVPPLEIWLLAHPEAARIARVRTVMDFLAERALAFRAAFSGE